MKNDITLSKIDFNTFNRKKYKRMIKKAFDKFSVVLRYSVVDDKELKTHYNDNAKNICSLMKDFLDNEYYYRIGNIHYLFYIMDAHFSFLSGVAPRVNDTQNMTTVGMMLKQVNEQTSVLYDALRKNKLNPVTSEQLQQWLNEQGKKEESTHVDA